MKIKHKNGLFSNEEFDKNVLLYYLEYTKEPHSIISVFTDGTTNDISRSLSEKMINYFLSNGFWVIYE